MPVSGYAVRMLWNNSPQGISETYYWNSTSDDPVLVIYPAALQLMKLRSALMGYGVKAVNFRISLLNNFRAYLNSKPQDVQTLAVGPPVLSINNGVPGLAPGVPATVDGSAAEANETIITTAYSTIQNHSRKFLSGCPSVMIRTSPTGPFIVGVSSWQQLFNAYANYLYGQPKWCFKARIPAAGAGQYAPTPVLKIQADPSANGTWDVEVGNTAGPPFAVGQTIQLRGFKMNSRAYYSFNGSWVIGSVAVGADVGTVWLQLQNSQLVAGTQVAIKGNARFVDYTLYPYTSIIPTSQGSHKRGNRSLASPGKLHRAQKVSS
jgi:hypothetical protein